MPWFQLFRVPSCPEQLKFCPWKLQLVTRRIISSKQPRRYSQLSSRNRSWKRPRNLIPSMQGTTNNSKHVYVIHRRSQDGLDSQWCSLPQIFEVPLEVWEHPEVWAGSNTWVTEMQESDCLEWEFWHGPVCVLGLVSGRGQSRHNLGKVWRVLQTINKWGVHPLWSSHNLQTRK